MGTIVAGTDGSAAARGALEAALELAHESNATLVIVTAWRELRGDFGLPFETLLPVLHLADIEREWADRTLVDAMAAAEEAGGGDLRGRARERRTFDRRRNPWVEPPRRTGSRYTSRRAKPLRHSASSAAVVA